MIAVKKIDTIEALNEILFEQPYDTKIGRNRSSCLYRGLPDESYRLVTSLKRNCKDKKNELEGSVLRNFTKYAAKEDPELKNSVWRQIIIGQHHGLPTRLLDWSYSPMVAMHFATSGENMETMDQHNCAVWKIDIPEMNTKMPEVYRKKLQEERAYLLTVEMMDALASNLKKFDQDMGTDALPLIEPPSIDQRIINQYSYFMVVPAGVTDVEEFLDRHTEKTIKYIIDKSLKWRLRDMLDQMNMNERSIYPGLDGLTQWIKRHYYVR